MAQEVGSPRSIVLATGSPGGVYLVYGQALAPILSRALQIEVTVEPTQGAVQNVILLEKRETMLAFINVGPALQGWNGSDWAKGTHYRAMRVMFPLYDTAFQFVAHNRVAAKSLDNFAGLRIGGGPRGGTSGAYVEQIFKVLGIPALVQHGAWDNLGQQLAERELDGAAAAIGAPFPALARLEQTVDFIAPSPEQIAGIRKQLPEITPSTIAAGTYRSLVKDYPTIGLYNFAVAHKDLSEDLVYRIVKAAFDHHADLVKAHPVAKETVPENIERNTLFPLHPGALRYYREKGIAVPATALGATN
jgi:TRAP transporter TAXI family solute receptor